jgi:hypothetical protein
MREDIGRYFEGRSLDTIKLIKLVYDTALGAGLGVEGYVEGRELVFSRGEPGVGRGFLRLISHETAVTIAFPRGQELLDPKKRLQGPVNSERRVLIRDSVDFDLYVRRLVEAACALEE